MLQIVRKVRESLTYLDKLDPKTRTSVRDSYEEAIQIAFVFSTILAAGSLLSAAFIKEKPLTRS